MLHYGQPPPPRALSVMSSHMEKEGDNEILAGAGISGKARAISQHETIGKSASSVQALQRVNRP